jgi:hypothetical protein
MSLVAHFLNHGDAETHRVVCCQRCLLPAVEATAPLCASVALGLKTLRDAMLLVTG